MVKYQTLMLFVAIFKDISCENSSIVVLNLTLQFIPVKQRQALINKIYQGLNPGGVLIVSEKNFTLYDEKKQTGSY